MRHAHWGVAHLAMTAAIAAIVVPAAAHAQGTAYMLDIPAGSLGDSLRALGETAQHQIMFSEDAVRGVSVPALHGSFTVDEALSRLLASTALRSTRTANGVISIGAPAALAPSPQETSAPAPEVVVTGTRIRRTDNDTAAPVVRVSGESLAQRGFAQAGDLLNIVTSNTPELPEAPFSGVPAGSGQTSPNLFGLGDSRTLTLVNGRRMVTSASGLGARTVDVNIIPAGLIDHIDIVEAGGAAVYGSDAIAGVVNYVLKRNFSGLELDAQEMASTRGTFSQPFLRLTAGKNFDGGRGNIAVDVEYSHSDPLLEADVPYFEKGPRSVFNVKNTSQSDGQPPNVIVYGGHLWRFNANGVVFAKNATAPSNLLQIGGSPVQFAADGQSLIPYNTGIIQPSSATVNNSSTAVGGEGYDTRYLSTFLSGVERYTASGIGHYDFTDHIRLSGEFLYSHERGTDTLATEDIQRTIGGGGSFAAVPFTKDNPYLSAGDVASLSAANAGFAAGGPLYLSKYFDILPSKVGISDTDTWRGLVALDGDFKVGDHNFYWSVSGSHAETNSVTSNWAQNPDHFSNAANAVMSGGKIVCAINADADPTNNDSACAPLNLFNTSAISSAARAYVSTYLQQRVHNKQDDFLATLGGEIVKLPAGPAQFSVAFEHRYESAAFTPSQTLIDGTPGFTSIPESGRYHTNEYSAELNVPLLGHDFTLPLVEKLEADGSYRHVDNSLAGQEDVWGAGLRWTVGAGLTLRGSRSRNFSAPTLDQQFAPTNVNPGNPAQDPCDATLINSGSNPTARLANCQKLFAAHPEYGPLATFSDPAINTGLVAITVGGNPGLKNEISDTLTLGAVYQPKYIPGLTISGDYIRINLTDALEPFGINDFLNACYDSVVQPTDICNTFTRNSSGQLVTGKEETFNAGSLQYRGEVYKVDYHMPLATLFAGNSGALDFHIEVTHNAYFNTSVTGFDHTRTDGTTSSPSWRGRFDLNYSRGPFRAFYSMYVLPDALASYTATIENTTVPVLSSTITHTVSFQYDVGPLTLRAGVNNLTDATPPLPSRTYGDIYGRRFFVGAKAHF